MLGLNWLSDNFNDFEYKKYLFLAYIQRIEKSYDEKKLFPHINELKQQYDAIVNFLEAKKEMENYFPKKLEGFDFKDSKLKFKSDTEDEKIIKELDRMIAFCLPMLQDNLIKGFSLIDLIKATIFFEPIGLEPIYLDEGYLLLNSKNMDVTCVYRYRKPAVKVSSEFPMTSLDVSHVKNYVQSLRWTPENIKYDLITNFEDLPNPATYSIQSEDKIPFKESLLPLAKGLVYKYICKEGRSENS